MAAGSSAVSSDGWQDYQPQGQSEDGWQDYAAPPQQPSFSSRFWGGVKHGMGDNSDAPPSHGTWSNPDFADNPMLPGSGVYRDIKAGNYAGAAGRIAGPAVALGSMFMGGRGGEAPVEAEPAPEPSGLTLRQRVGGMMTKAAGKVDPDAVGMVSPRAAHFQRAIGRIGDRLVTPAEAPEEPEVVGRLKDIIASDRARVAENQSRGLGLTRQNYTQADALGDLPNPAAQQAIGRLKDAIQPNPQSNFRVEQTPRRLPGEIAPEATRPRAFSPRTAEAIPPRRGLLLPGATENASPPLIEQIRTSQDVTPALSNKSKIPDYYATDEKSWQRYSRPGSAQDMEETKDIQAQVRETAGKEQRGRLARANEEGYARNTRPRTPKGELIRRAQAGRLADKVRQGQGSGSEDLSGEWQKNLDYLKTKKAKPQE